MFTWWNDLPSTIKDMVRLILVLILQQITQALQKPPTVNVQPSPVVFSTQPATESITK